jgi:monoterpene epsilon-lactone hydrolase
MATEQSQANKAHYERLVAQAASGNTPSPEEGDIIWGNLTKEPEGVGYVKVDAGGVPAMWIVPNGCATDRVILYAHGGGCVAGSIQSHRKMVAHLAKTVGCRALIFDYPYAFQQKHPAQLDVTVQAYRWLLAEGVEPMHIACAGDSVGAILVFGLLQRARSSALPLPAAIMIISGWLDMTVSAPSFDTNCDKDLFFSRQTVEWLASNFLGDGNRRDPLASPVFADFSGFPPIFLQVGADEAIVDESRALADRARSAGVDVRLDVFPNMLHSFQMLAGHAPEADDAIGRFADWVRPKLGLST